MENENVIEHTYADEVSPLTLAFVGDAVYTLRIREHLATEKRYNINTITISY